MSLHDVQPKVSIIMSVYNNEDTIRESLQSALCQSLKDIEILCVYKKSNDKTTDILFGMAREYAHIKLIEQKDSVGCGNAKNIGMQNACGEYITFLDADDLYANHDCIEKIYYAAREHGAKICGGLRQFISGHDVTAHPLHREVLKSFPDGTFLRYMDYQFDYHFHSYLYEKKMIEENEIKFGTGRTYDDCLFHVNAMLDAEKFFITPYEMYIYRSHGPYDWNYEQTYDAMVGMAEMLALSRKKHLAVLHWKTFKRVGAYEFFRNFDKYLTHEHIEFLHLLIHTQSEVDMNLINEVQNSLPLPVGVLDTQDVDMHKIIPAPNGEYILPPLAGIFKDAERLREDIVSLKNSRSYKAGRMITWLPRTVREKLFK